MCVAFLGPVIPSPSTFSLLWPSLWGWEGEHFPTLFFIGGLVIAPSSGLAGSGKGCVGAWSGRPASGAEAERLPADLVEMQRSAFLAVGSPVFLFFRKT